MRYKHTKLLSLIAAAAVTNAPVAQADRWSGKWFEVEVILLSQLDDKSTIREHFDEGKPLPKYRRFYDLLTPYLQPDIASLKQALPLCSDGKDPLAALAAMPKLPQFHEIKTLEEIEQLPVLPFDEPSAIEGVAEGNEFVQAETAPLNQPSESNTFSSQAEPEEQAESESATGSVIIAQDDAIEDVTDTKALTEEQQQLLAAAQAAFDPIQYHYDRLLEPFPDSFCILSQEEFNQLDVNPARYTYNGFLVEEMPRWIDGIEDIDSVQPYLLSRASLKLHDIVKQLTRSPQFRPILHLGWRQQAYQLNKSTPVKLSAGSNLQAHFVKQLEQYLADKKAHEDEEAQLANILADTGVNAETQANATTNKTQQTVQHIASVLQQVSDISPENTPIESLASMPIQKLPFENTEEMVFDAPRAPAQPWYVDGFLRIHLNRNFLNVTADFNIMNLTLAEQATLALSPNNDVELKPIHFSQARRIISREIHYFDHPYMGMIVQVRRYNKPTKADTE